MQTTTTPKTPPKFQFHQLSPRRIAPRPIWVSFRNIWRIRTRELGLLPGESTRGNGIGIFYCLENPHVGMVVGVYCLRHVAGRLQTRAGHNTPSIPLPRSPPLPRTPTPSPHPPATPPRGHCPPPLTLPYLLGNVCVYKWVRAGSNPGSAACGGRSEHGLAES